MGGFLIKHLRIQNPYPRTEALLCCVFSSPPLFSVGLVLGCFFVSGVALGLVCVWKRLGKAGFGLVWLEKAAFDKLRFHCRLQWALSQNSPIQNLRYTSLPPPSTLMPQTPNHTGNATYYFVAQPTTPNTNPPKNPHEI